MKDIHSIGQAFKIVSERTAKGVPECLLYGKGGKKQESSPQKLRGKIKILFYGGRQAGMIVLLTLKALGQDVIVIPEDEIIKQTAKDLSLITFDKKTLSDESKMDFLITQGFDLFVCCHGRKIIKKQLLNKIPSINLHPCLYKYKGATPIKRMLADRITKASVACHHMTEKVDDGETIIEVFKEVTGRTEVEVYNELYPVYSEVIIRAIQKL